MARPVPTLKEQQAAAQKEDEEGMVTRRRCWSDGPGVQHPGGAKLDPTLEEQTVLVNFTMSVFALSPRRLERAELSKPSLLQPRPYHAHIQDDL